MSSSSMASKTPSRPMSTCRRNPIIRPGMVAPLPDCRRQMSITSDLKDQPRQSTNKHKAPATNPADPPEPVSESSIVCLNPELKKKKKSHSKKNQVAPPQEQHVSSNFTRQMLRADSDEDSAIKTDQSSQFEQLDGEPLVPTPI
ncbi:uncharacterized protein MELLADRAFT_111781 [Melampsora larici-populina 98AG31]|uniref:Uncharacterized protein n=1 Tax=Melampsora larici-populina (strain 98AG31 / pathotype 3-4-7) TaxID=747676 RepID=F4S477_MELLP|nr:uncharacterized protein MELLADRAFT_111781 [Melampsora larici-populina 98AG31]EGG00536.1 hypothetical protein MELLADRAFT_111781 [Melampsora larici-populina 98AG31]